MTREQVLSAVRAALGRTPGMTVTQLSVFRRSAAPHFDRVATFRTALEEVGGHFHDARHEPAEALILRVARESGCSRVFAGPGVTLDVASASRDEALTRPRDAVRTAAPVEVASVLDLRDLKNCVTARGERLEFCADTIQKRDPEWGHGFDP